MRWEILKVENFDPQAIYSTFASQLSLVNSLTGISWQVASRCLGMIMQLGCSMYSFEETVHFQREGASNITSSNYPTYG